jgi:hypothetical protein
MMVMVVVFVEGGVDAGGDWWADLNLTRSWVDLSHSLTNH